MSSTNLEQDANYKKIVIVGGGTAAWLAAWIFQEHLSSLQEPTKIIMIESSKIPTIGVGEGTTALFKSFLDHFKLDEAEFLKETRATIKLGIRHRNWTTSGQYYDGPIDDPHWENDVPGEPGAENLNIYAIANDFKVSQSHHFTHLIKESKVPFVKNKDGSISRVSAFENAYHFDNAKVAAWLKKRSTNLEIIDAVVIDIEINENGDISTLVLDDGNKLAGDFFIDCTGFKKLLIGRLQENNWTSYKESLPLNRAFPFQLKHHEANPIISYTHAWAMNYGWLWQIPTQDRIGNGYAFCDEYVSREDAIKEIETKLNTEIEPLADIKFNVGRLNNVWINNCIAVGLSASFLEPLEATSIHSTLVQLLVFDREYLKNIFNVTDEDKQNFNNLFNHVIDDFRSFLYVHYQGSRSDTAFWHDIKNNYTDENGEKFLELWRTKMPDKHDFPDYLGGLPHAQAQLYYPVLNGLGLLDKNLAKEQLAKTNLSNELGQTWKVKVSAAKQIASRAMSHYAFLTAINKDTPIVLPK